MNTSYTNEERVLDDEFQGFFSHLNIVFVSLFVFALQVYYLSRRFEERLEFFCVFLTDFGILGIEFSRNIFQAHFLCLFVLG